jgi:hypothetical protein
MEGKNHPGKVNFIKNNLTLLIRNISIDYRINLWMLLIRPLFLPLAMMNNYLSKTSKKAMQTKLQKSIKWFLGLSKNTPNKTIDCPVKVDFDEWARIEQQRADLKWQSRKKNEKCKELLKYEIECKAGLLPKEAAQFINLQNVPCKQCQSIFSASHYEKHGIKVPKLEELIETSKTIIRQMSRNCTKPKRQERLDATAQVFLGYIGIMKNKVQEIKPKLVDYLYIRTERGQTR